MNRRIENSFLAYRVPWGFMPEGLTTLAVAIAQKDQELVSQAQYLKIVYLGSLLGQNKVKSNIHDTGEGIALRVFHR